MEFKRITVDPNQMGGMPCIRGLRIPVATVVGMVADGMTVEDIPLRWPCPTPSPECCLASVSGMLVKGVDPTS